MSSMLDTLKYYRQLRGAGIEDRQAQAIAEGLAEAILGSLATKGDLRSEVTDLRAELKADIAKLDERVSRLEGRFDGLQGQCGTLQRMMLGLYAYATVAIALVAIFVHAR